MFRLPPALALALALSSGIMASWAWAAGPPGQTTQVDFRVFPGLAMMDGNWAALFAASDGKVYAGLAYHGGDGHLVYYDSETDRMHDVGNLTALCGESFLKRGPQSKIHAKFGEGKDGRIYFGTHGGNWWDYARFGAKEGYPGAHWMAYDPKTGRVEDFGLACRNEGINTGAYDPVWHRIYGVEESATNLFSFDPRCNDVRRLGQLCIPGFEERRDVPYATLSLTLTGDRKLYYAAAGREFDYSGSAEPATSHLISYDLKTGKTADQGAMLLPDGRRVLGTNAATTGPDDTVYFVGAIEVRPEAGKPVEAAGKSGNVYYRLAMLWFRTV